MNKILKVGIIGAGWSASKNISPAIDALPGVSIHAIADINKDLAQKLAGERSIPNVHENYKELCNRDDIDFVIISVPHGLHCQYALDALNARKHVLVEKPMATTVEDAEKMIHLAEKQGLHLGVYFQNRFNDSTRVAKEILDAGKLGSILSTNVSVFLKRDPPYFKSSWRGTWNLEGGSALINQSIHAIDKMLYLLGDATTVFGLTGHHVHDIETEDNAVACFKLKNQAFGLIQASIGTKNPIETKLTIFGTEGAMEIDMSSVKIYYNDDKSDVFDFKNETEGINAKKIKQIAHQRVITDFASSIIENRKPLVDGKEGLRSLKLIRGIYESNGGTVVKLTG
ncbi:MAG: Gfo/Idh/MocA family protein [Candidatus Hodarchaeota archaeon]